jgi:hypothetical protein
MPSFGLHVFSDIRHIYIFIPAPTPPKKNNNNLVCKLESSREAKVDFLQISKVVEPRVFVFTHMFHISIIMPAQVVAANLIT